MPERIIIDVTEKQFSPGRFLLAATDKGLCKVAFPTESRTSFERWLKLNFNDPELRESAEKFDEVMDQLKAYFEGTLTEFNLKLDLCGTSFQQQVWQALINIPYGKTASYGDIAKVVHLPDASRAVGAANGANPIPVIVPCHRVIGSDGKLTGFGGGLPLKEKLLMLEGLMIEKGRVTQQHGQQSLFDLTST
jgi:methylated-DNA-[protein]-cysteine S-methyltransferase